MKPQLLRLFRVGLLLYPRAFCDEFGDEMVTVFHAALDDSAARGRWHALRTVAREYSTLPIQAIRQHLHARHFGENAMTPFDKQRRRLRALSVIMTLVLLALSTLVAFLFAGPNLAGTNAVRLLLIIVVFHTIMFAGFLVAFRWERYGGVVVLTNAATLGVILVMIFANAGFLTSGVLVTALWTLPYAILGAGFISLERSRRPAS